MPLSSQTFEYMIILQHSEKQLGMSLRSTDFTKAEAREFCVNMSLNALLNRVLQQHTMDVKCYYFTMIECAYIFQLLKVESAGESELW